ncbi:acyl-CoA thioesterase [Streptomyces heilongjiangensis]|uniref:Acyl-CoA thioesterase n=1 Tax=Streptomyces heilongjiangensis TaxID=945052 RepID=A0ABW1AZJ9_9ACTN|nr:thioesterase family protein [Streptomyces heilongjiangensis]MDC2947906.1 thioesterase family protein [Streptomyces heilongjiangensis]
MDTIPAPPTPTDRHAHVDDVRVEPVWRAWAGAHGGYVAALGLDAMRRRLPPHCADSATVRSVTTQFLAPVRSDTLRLEAAVHPAGRSGAVTTFLGTQDGRTVVAGSAVFGTGRPGPDRLAPTMPDVPPAEGLTSFALPADLVPFGQLLDIRPATSVLPLSGSPDAELTAWVRFLDGRPVDSPTGLVLADALPAGIFARWRRPRPVPSADLTAHFTGETTEGWALVRIRTDHAAHGWTIDDSSVWSADGRLILMARQSRRITQSAATPPHLDLSA